MCYLKSFTAVIAAIALSAVTLSCSKDQSSPTPKIDNSLTATVVSQDFTQVSVAFVAGADVKSVKYNFGPAFTQYQDSTKFANGTLTGSTTLDASAGGFSIKPSEGEPVIIYLRPVASDGTKGDVICVKAAASPVDYKISKASLGSFVYTVPSTMTEYAGISFLAMDAAAPTEWGMTAEEIVDMYASYGLLDVTTPGNDDMVELNGEPSFEHIVGVVFWNADYTYSFKIFNFTTGYVIPGAPAASILASVSNITSENADLNFSPSSYTCGYCYKLFTKEDYEAAKQEGQKLGEDPDIHVRDQVAAAASMNFRIYTDSRTGLKPDTEYVLTCYPYNINGSQGWGQSQIINFKTEADI